MLYTNKYLKLQMFDEQGVFVFVVYIRNLLYVEHMSL